MRALALAALTLSLALPAAAEGPRDRASAGGYFRIMTRPDLQGGQGRLGHWNLYGRLLNEGPWASLDLRLDLLQEEPGSGRAWSSVHAKIEGGSVRGADTGGGSLANFSLRELYVLAGNTGLQDVTWQLGTLTSTFGDLGLYDFRPADLFGETVGLSARWRPGPVELLLGAGDAGFALRPDGYDAVFSAGGSLRVPIGTHVQLGVGGQGFLEREAKGNRFAPHTTQGIDYADLARGEVVSRYVEENPLGQFDLDRRPSPTQAASFKAVGWFGFGELGPLDWNSLYVSYERLHPEATRTETFSGKEYTLWVAGYTDERYRLQIGDQADLRLWPGWLDASLGAFYGREEDRDDTIVASERNRWYASGVLRLQLYLTTTLHLLTEASLAREVSTQGNLYREHHDSVFRSTDGLSDARGFANGDTDTRDTLQLKAGPVLNPLGRGIFTRPSLRLLFGVQRSNVHDAFASAAVESLDQYELFDAGADRPWHALVALEAEAWF